MVTASHNDNGWTGVKMGANRPLTFGPDEMKRLKEIVLGAQVRPQGRRQLTCSWRISPTATSPTSPSGRSSSASSRSSRPAATAPPAPSRRAILQAIGCDVVPLDCELDYTFPRYNPNTEDMKMLHAMRDAVLINKADVALGFDGDGDRCGVVDNEGEEIFADKVGVMLARDMSSLHKNATFVVDVKSTGLFLTDPVLKANGVKVDYWKTGHSYIKRRVNELGALAGFEKSGHFFFNKPYGRGYDDGMIFALAVCDMLDRNPGKSMADLRKALPKTWGSPTMSPHCDDEKKYGVVDAVVKHFEAMPRPRARRSPGKPSAIWSPSTACASRSRTAPGAWCAPRRTSRSWWWWWRARCRRRACATCSRRSTACCARTRKSASIIRRFERRLKPPISPGAADRSPRSGRAAG